MSHPCKECLSYVPQAKCSGNGPSIGITDISKRQKPCGLYKTEVEVTPIDFKPTMDVEVKAVSKILDADIVDSAMKTRVTESQANLAKLTIKTLKKLCDDKGIKYKARETKTELIKLLKKGANNV